MEKAFVNTKEIVISGKQVFEAKKAEIEKKFEQDKTKIPEALATEPALLNDKANSLLLGICTIPGLKRDTKAVIFSILDDGTEVAKIDKNALIDACESNRSADKTKGITYSVALFEHAVVLNYRFQNRMEVIGDISGVQFFFKK